MIEDFLKKARKLAYDEVKKTGMPIKPHIDLACEVGRRLAKELGAKIDIVEAGTLLMDCLLGQAIKENRIQDHIQMSLKKANELLARSALSEEDKENICHCISEHHGANKFYSLESEICCNADCYRFLSIKGFVFVMRGFGEMPLADLMAFLGKKVEEKWSLVSLDRCKKELGSQYRVITNLMEELSRTS